MDEPLTDWLKNKLTSMALLGCDRTTLCKYAGISSALLQRELQADAQFTRDLLQAEADAEARHMKTIHLASQDEKNWRSSTWWIERRAELDGDGVGDPAALPPEVCRALEELADIIVLEIADGAARESLRRRLLQVVEQSREEAT
jgi:hypothetical protein